ncbi:putative F-box protein At1g19160 [Papaver somniferum]|uniref:putative F-box protein At1g19160 n=1 Tax=Papaver somniferum TaxID=3469 RepID=UPI000E6F59F1|nr:putative F-box protein At1g19160 [Papaver somniferum]
MKKTISFVGSINGLMCIARGPSVCICNPITREYVMLPEINRDCGDYYDFWASSFGYVSSTNEYKVVVIYVSERKTHVEVRIYTIGSGTGWRNIGKFNFGSNLHNSKKVLFANGALYWMDDGSGKVVTFDLAEEKFFENLSPPPLPQDGECCHNRIWVLNGSLFYAVVDEEDGFFDLQLLEKKNNNHDMKVSDQHQSLGWSKWFRVDDREVLAFTKRDAVLTYRYWYINIYHTKTSTSKGLAQFKNMVHQVSPHKNTLVSLKEQGEKDTRIMESDEIEKTKGREQPQKDANPEYIIVNW